MKKFTIVIILAVAMLTASPRPASAQFSAFMEWLNNLDPGGFYLAGYHVDLKCIEPTPGQNWLRPVASDPKHFGCKAPESSHLIFGADVAAGWGKRNVEPDPSSKMGAFSVIGTLSANVGRGVQLGTGFGINYFKDSPTGTTNWVLRGDVGFSPAILFRRVSSQAHVLSTSGGNTFWTNMQIRIGANIFLREFQPADFGAPPGPGYGHYEIVPTFGLYFGHWKWGDWRF